MCSTLHIDVPKCGYPPKPQGFFLCSSVHFQYLRICYLSLMAAWNMLFAARIVISLFLLFSLARQGFQREVRSFIKTSLNCLIMREAKQVSSSFCWLLCACFLRFLQTDFSFSHRSCPDGNWQRRGCVGMAMLVEGFTQIQRKG